MIQLTRFGFTPNRRSKSDMTSLERGVTQVEYITILAVLAIVAVTAFVAIDDAVDKRTKRMQRTVQTSGPCGGLLQEAKDKECL